MLKDAPIVRQPEGLLQALVNERANNPTRYSTGLSGRLYPNGDFTLGKVPPKYKTPKEEAFDNAWEAQLVWVENRYPFGWKGREGLVNWRLHEFLSSRCQVMKQRVVTKTWKLDNGVRVAHKTLVVLYGFFSGYEHDGGDIEGDSPLGLSTLPNSHKPDQVSGDDDDQDPETPCQPRKKRGLKGITGNGKRMVSSAAWTLQKAYGKNQLGFGTVTLPSFPDRPELLVVLVEKWPELVRQFFQQLTRYLKRSGYPARWVGVTEIQPERLEKRDEPAPHLHFVYHAHNGDYRWFISANEMRRIWRQILEAAIEPYTDGKYSVNTQAAIDTQSVKKDAGAYLAKYMSKGGDVIKMMKDKGLESFIPSAWWHCCLELKRAVKSLIVELPSDFKTAIAEGVDLVARGLAFYLKEVIIDDKKYGWVGRLKRSLSRDKKLLQVIESFEKPLPIAA